MKAGQKTLVKDRCRAVVAGVTENGTECGGHGRRSRARRDAARLLGVQGAAPRRPPEDTNHSSGGMKGERMKLVMVRATNG
jgi:hypothetical protein